MEQWLLYAILSALTAGVYSFCLKVVSERGYHVTAFLSVSSMIALVCALQPFVFSNVQFDRFSQVFFLASVSAFLYYFTSTTRIESLKYIHTTIYFPIYKTLGPIIATGVGLLFFREVLTTSQMWGVVLGVIVPLLLISKGENVIQNNLKKGFVFLAIGAIFSVGFAMMMKLVRIGGFSVDLYILVYLVIFTAMSWFSFMRSRTTLSVVVSPKFLALTIVAGVVLYAGTAFTLKAFTGSFVVVFTINAFSILIPIILSIIVYKEHINFRKVLVIILSIASTLLFGIG